ncbi:glycosyl transferase family 28 [Prosthecobacter fusiformis]|uniref:Glycosyl transferase family 28 n=2 Tax=Prosthecobacter fusiformis TaxID=48464 RepID=A0A4R7S127_9BACT|nr:glycosyl transferase family 28 [Prosthecobacter fusiformis]
MPEWSVEALHSLLAEQAFEPQGFILDLIATPLPLVIELKKRGLVLSIGGAGEGRDEVDVRIDGMIPRPDFHGRFTGRELHLGPEFVILRDVFVKASPHLPPPVLSRVLITLGGDAEGRGLNLGRDCAHTVTSLLFDVVVGPLYRGRLEEGPSSLTLHQTPNDMLTMLQRAEVVICSGGMTAYECCRLGLPMIIFPQTPLQRDAACTFVSHGAALMAETSHEVCQTLVRLQDEDLRASLSTQAQRLVDGQGLYRVASLIESTFSN